MSKVFDKLVRKIMGENPRSEVVARVPEEMALIYLPESAEDDGSPAEIVIVADLKDRAILWRGYDSEVVEILRHWPHNAKWPCAETHGEGGFEGTGECEIVLPEEWLALMKRYAMKERELPIVITIPCFTGSREEALHFAFFHRSERVTVNHDGDSEWEGSFDDLAIAIEDALRPEPQGTFIPFRIGGSWSVYVKLSDLVILYHIKS